MRRGHDLSYGVSTFRKLAKKTIPASKTRSLDRL